MVARMMKWRPWPPLSSKKFQAKIVVCCLQGLPDKITSAGRGGGDGCGEPRDFSRLGVEVKWKGSNKSNIRLNFKRSSLKRNLTKEESLNDDGVVEWNEEFVAVCNLVGSREGGFHQWEVAFTVFDGLNQEPKRWDHAVATGSLNLAEFASGEQEKTAISIHLSAPGCSIECSPILSVSLSLLELRTAHEVTELAQSVPLPLSSWLDHAALRGDWDDARDFIDQDEEAVTANINKYGFTALHIAVGTGKQGITFVEKLVEKIPPKALLKMLTSSEKYTPLHIAAVVGNTTAVKILVNKNRNLLYAEDVDGLLPIHRALINSHKDTFLYLLSVTKGNQYPCTFTGNMGVTLLSNVIFAGYFDIALDLVARYPDLATTIPSDNVDAPLMAIARKADAFESGCRLSFFDSLIYKCKVLFRVRFPYYRCSSEVGEPQLKQAGGDELLRFSATYNTHSEDKAGPSSSSRTREMSVSGNQCAKSPIK